MQRALGASPSRVSVESADEPRMAEVCQGQRDTSAILMRADKALYDARRTGREKSILASDYL